MRKRERKVRLIEAKGYIYDGYRRALERYEDRGWENVMDEQCICDGCVDDDNSCCHDFAVILKRD